MMLLWRIRCRMHAGMLHVQHAMQRKHPPRRMVQELQRWHQRGTRRLGVQCTSNMESMHAIQHHSHMTRNEKRSARGRRGQSCPGSH